MARTGTIVGERGYTYPVKVNLAVFECPSPNCGVVYGIPVEFRDSLYANGGSYYCPNGHKLSWSEDEAQRQRKRAERAERAAKNAEEAARYQRQRAEREERSARAYRGHLTRMRNRVAAGVCPVPGCKRTGLVQTMKHLASKHPDWLADHVHDLA